MEPLPRRDALEAPRPRATPARRRAAAGRLGVTLGGIALPPSSCSKLSPITAAPATNSRMRGRVQSTLRSRASRTSMSASCGAARYRARSPRGRARTAAVPRPGANVICRSLPTQRTASCSTTGRDAPPLAAKTWFVPHPKGLRTKKFCSSACRKKSNDAVRSLTVKNQRRKQQRQRDGTAA
jgi:hypothetical protein